MVSLSAYLKYKTKGDVTMDELRINELNDFQNKALRTWNKDQPKEMRLLNAGAGLCGESGEVIDMLKKAIFHGHGFVEKESDRGTKKIDKHEVALELGDIMYYVAIEAEELGYTLQEVAEMVIRKLAKRYPEGFSVEASINRVDVRGETLGLHYKNYTKEDN